MTRPDTVVFDIGGVLLDWDPRYLYRKIFAGREAEMEWFLAHVCTPEWNLAQDAGRPWEDAVREAIAAHPAHEASIRAYRERWPEMIAGDIGASVDILESLHAAGVPLYAITNFAADTFALVRAAYPFLGRFGDVVVSGEEKVLKPDRRIFDILVERNGLDRGRLVFIDDSARNVEGARAAGLHAIHFTGSSALRAALVGFGFGALAA